MRSQVLPVRPSKANRSIREPEKVVHKPGLGLMHPWDIIENSKGGTVRLKQKKDGK